MKADGGWTKEVAAIVRFERAAAGVSAIQKEIGAALSRCSVEAEIERATAEGRFRDAESLVDGTRTKTHLYHALLDREPCDSGYGERRLESHEIEERLEYECPACLEAWRLIERRRAARMELGIAKRALRSIGKAAIRRTALAKARGESA